MRVICSLSIAAALAAQAFADTRSSKQLEVRSPAFAPGAAIPAEYTCDGQNVSPPLTWTKPPAGTKSVAVVVDDPDAPNGTFTHWIVTNLPHDAASLDADAKLPDGARTERNDKGGTGWTGPCPPSGTHHYRFRVYALDQRLPNAATSRDDLLKMIDGHVLAEGLLVATYKR
jgi:Raf kinase inhibitor-like YbhB/YbcL family protein